MKILSCSLVFLVIQLSLLSQTIHHEIKADINIQDHRIEVIDAISFPKDLMTANPDLIFSLNAELTVHSADGRTVVEEMPGEEEKDASVVVKKYRIRIKENVKEDVSFKIGYSGIINDDIVTGAAEYARGFSETSGIISETGIYLAGSSQWIPEFNNDALISFTLDVTVDPEWSIVSQGTRVIHETLDGKEHIRYESPEPMDEIYLIGGKWTEYSIPSEKVLLQAFLRTPDETLANKYLRATQGYLSMYEKMIGPYPYTKFALVENFWETGYGMPSFTLLGPKVIRFPWILYSSYPHELLHNYWGNGVYVDYESGNWCEGITAYMADHLLKEQQGQGAGYRQSTLQKYTDFVHPDNDFPLTGFLSRNNSAEEAIGYGKCLMMNNMLRTTFGDEMFLKAYSMLYADYKFARAGFSDIQRCFEEVTGTDLSSFFHQWTERTGAPSLKLSDVAVKRTGSSYDLSFHLSQIQPEEVFELDIPVYVYMEGESEVNSVSIQMKNRTREFHLEVDKRPVRIEIDPTFQLFRRLDRNEVPTTMTQLFGAKESVVILPSESPSLAKYREMAELWKATQEAQGKTMEITNDNELSELPSDMTVWVFGFANLFFPSVQIPQKYMEEFPADQKEVAETLRNSGSLVYAIQNPGNEDLTLGFVGTHDPGAIEGLGRKLPHYGKYSYLGFEGDEPVNKAKRVFPALGSPLNYAIPYNGKVIKMSSKIVPRKALSE